MRDLQKFEQDAKNDSIIRDQMASLGCLLVCTFGYILDILGDILF